MAENIVELLTDVADAIRGKKGSTEKINAQNFANEIKNLPSGGASGDIIITSLTDNFMGEVYADTQYELLVGGNTITTLGIAAFSGDKRLIKATIGGIVTNIDTNAFMNCINLAELFLADGLTIIGANAFSGVALKEVSLPSSLTSIASNSFSNCASLSKVIVSAVTPPKMWAISFENNAADRLIYVPDESLEAYKSATNWSAYADAIRPMSELPNE